MKRKVLLVIFLGVFFLLPAKTTLAQFYFLEDSYDQIELKFLKKKIETNKGQTFFNVVSISNPSNRSIEFILKFSYPALWSFFGESQQRLTINPNDTLFIPYRAAVSNNVKGDIGYAIVASITDLKGNPIKNEYSFITVPKIQRLVYKPLKRIVYTNPANKTTELQLFVANYGNTDETCYIDISLDDALKIESVNERFYREIITLRPLNDTIIKIPVTLLKELNYENKYFHRIGVKTYTQDTSYYSTIWLKELRKDYFNPIPDDYKLAVLNVSVHDLFKETNPTLSVSVLGNILLKKPQRNIFYFFQGNGRNFISDPWKYSKIYATYSQPNLSLTIGDVFENIGQSSFGRGFSFKIKSEKYTLNTFLSSSIISDKKVAGLSISNKNKFSNITLGGSFSQDNELNKTTSIGQFSFSKSFKKIGSLNTGLYASLMDYAETGKKTIGYSGNVSYNLSLFKTKISASAIYGEKSYGGNNSGRLQVNGRVFHPLSKKTTSSLTFYQSIITPSRYIGDSLLPSSYNQYNKTELLFYSILKNNVRYTAGINSYGKKSNQIVDIVDKDYFSTRSYQFKGNIRFKNTSQSGTYNFSFEGGLVHVTDYPKIYFDSIPVNKNWLIYQINTNFDFRLWSLYLSYVNGPNAINQEYSYFATNYFTKYLRAMPSIDIPIVRNKLHLQSNINYAYDISAKVNRLNMMNNLVASLNQTIELIFSASYIYQSNYDQILDEKFTYSGTYFELSLKKDFLINQMRYQYHDLDIYFFKDYNGNGIQDNDEPGLSGILFEIQRDDQATIEASINSEGNFMPTELISDLNGHIQYKNIPNGFYFISYLPTTEIQGSFSSADSKQSIYLGENKKLYIPFTENNKIFGNVLLNRSKLSNLGVIDVSNIKVTAENSTGRRYSTLTDAQGNFTIYVPSVDNYKVRVNNIFFENFELEQNDYEVQLNGYRQFEVNFIFNEKKRKINFATDYEYGSRQDGTGVEIVRRTNLSGLIKDATTLLPISALVRVIDEKGDEVTSVNSNPKTGLYSTSFVAGNDYSVEVIADQYWYYAEKLYSQQIVTFKNLNKEILMKAITVGSIIPMNTLNFASGSAEIPATSFPELERLLKVLRKNPSVKIDVHGHADDLEIRETQEDLALERAKIIAKYLIANGYNRVKYSGHANTKPIADNDTETGRAQNRRVEIVVTGK